MRNRKREKRRNKFQFRFSRFFFHFFFFFLFIAYLSCSSSKPLEEDIFEYLETVELYCLTKYLQDVPFIQSRLAHYDLLGVVNQSKYRRSLEAVSYPEEKWRDFHIDTIHWYIEQFIHLQKNPEIRYYQSDAYSEPTQQFDSEKLLSSDILPNEYWKVQFWTQDGGNSQIVLREFYKKQTVSSRFFYSQTYQLMKIETLEEGLWMDEYPFLSIKRKRVEKESLEKK